MAPPLKILELEFTILEFHPTYVISQPREGQIITGKQLEDLVVVCGDFYQGKPFVYISYRIHDLNVSPVIYLNLDQATNLAGIVVVSQRASSLNMANFEKKFCKVSYEIFMELDPALEWVKKRVEDYRKKADL